jgi:predicted GTPase
MWKVSVVGSAESGKSSIISRIVFDSDVGNFMGKGLLRKKITVDREGKTNQAELIFQEIDGFPENEKLLAGSAAIIVVIDVTKKVQTNEIENFIKVTRKKQLIILAANKIDRKYEAVTWSDELEPFAQKMDVELFLVSSKMPETVLKMIQKVASDLMGKLNGK